MTASIFSTLSGTLAGKHPELPVLVDVEGRVYNRNRASARSKTPTYSWVYGSSNHNGYKRICIRYKQYHVHRLVAETFLPNKDNKPTVDHIDRNPENNRLENLRWATQKEQIRNSGTFKHPKWDVGIRYKDNPREYQRRYKLLQIHDPESNARIKAQKNEAAKRRRAEAKKEKGGGCSLLHEGSLSLHTT